MEARKLEIRQELNTLNNQIEKLERQREALVREQTRIRDTEAARRDAQCGIYDSWYEEEGKRADGGQVYIQAWQDVKEQLLIENPDMEFRRI